MKLCVIPARGGSKRIPRKNIREFGGKPMIAWSIKAALASGCFDQVIVSTDDDEIAKIAESFGAEVPFRRPADLADDQTATRPVVIHVIQEVEKDFGRTDHVCVIYPTAPFIQVADLHVVLINYRRKCRFCLQRHQLPLSHPTCVEAELQRWSRHAPARASANSFARPRGGLSRCRPILLGPFAGISGGSSYFFGRIDAHHPSEMEGRRVDTREDWQQAELIFVL